MTLIWSPDTCFCEYEVLVVTQGVNQILQLVSVKILCSIHNHMGDQGAFSSALNRNTSANSQGNSAEAKLNMKKSTHRT